MLEVILKVIHPIIIEYIRKLRTQYPDIQQVLMPSEARKKVLNQLLQVFTAEVSPSKGAFSEVGANTIKRIFVKLNELERNIISNTKDEETIQQYRSVFEGIRKDLSESPEDFLSDTVAWIESNLKRAGGQPVPDSTLADVQSKYNTYDQTVCIYPIEPTLDFASF